MPVRDKAQATMTEFLVGPMSYSHGIPVGGQGVSPEQFEAISDYAEELYCRAITAVDWNRVMLEAAGRCERNRRDDPDHYTVEDSFGLAKAGDTLLQVVFCPKCLERALLTFNKVGEGEEETDLPDVHASPRWEPPRKLRHLLGEWVLARRKELEDGPDDDDKN